MIDEQNGEEELSKFIKDKQLYFFMFLILSKIPREIFEIDSNRLLRENFTEK